MTTRPPRTYFAENVELPIPHTDAGFIENVVKDNDHWNRHGITAPDISVCLEMSWLCDYRSTFTVARFRAALEAARSDGLIRQVGDRWFHRDSPYLKALLSDDKPARTCSGPRCDKAIQWDRRGLYCSPKCQQAAARKRASEARLAA